MADYTAQIGVNIPSVPNIPLEDPARRAVAAGLRDLSSNAAQATAIFARNERQQEIALGAAKADQVYGLILPEIQQRRFEAEESPGLDPRKDPLKYGRVLEQEHQRGLKMIEATGGGPYAVAAFNDAFDKLRTHELQSFGASSYKKWSVGEALKNREAMQAWITSQSSPSATLDPTAPGGLIQAGQKLRSLALANVYLGESTKEQAEKEISEGLEAITLNRLAVIVDQKPNAFIAGVKAGQYDAIPRSTRDVLVKRAYDRKEQDWQNDLQLRGPTPLQQRNSNRLYPDMYADALASRFDETRLTKVNEAMVRAYAARESLTVEHATSLLSTLAASKVAREADDSPTKEARRQSYRSLEKMFYVPPYESKLDTMQIKELEKLATDRLTQLFMKETVPHVATSIITEEFTEPLARAKRLTMGQLADLLRVQKGPLPERLFSGKGSLDEKKVAEYLLAVPSHAPLIRQYRTYFKIHAEMVEALQAGLEADKALKQSGKGR